MAHIRLIIHSFYDIEKGRFQSQAFEVSSRNKGISTIDTDCVEETGIGLCEHIETFYSGIAGGSTIFLEEKYFDLPDSCEFLKTEHPSGDECHTDIFGLSKSQGRKLAKRMFKRVTLENFRICSEGEIRDLQEEDLAEISG